MTTCNHDDDDDYDDDDDNDDDADEEEEEEEEDDESADGDESGDGDYCDDYDVCDVCAASYSRVVQGPQGSHRNPWFKDAEVMWVEQCHKPSIWEWFIPTRSN